MTITSTPSEVAYAGDGVSTVFTIPFVFDTSADLKVVETSSTGVPTVVTTGFSIGGGAGLTGTLTRSVALPVGTTLLIIDNPALTQTADYIDNDSFPATAHESALDHGVRISKRLNERVDRSLRVADGDLIDGDNNLLPISSVRASKYLVFDATGKPTVGSGTGGGDAALRADLASTTSGVDGSRLSGFRRTDVGSVARSVYDKLAEALTIQDFGAKGDGATDDAAAFLAAANSGVRVRIPATTNGYLIGSTVTPTRPFFFQGDLINKAFIKCAADVQPLLINFAASGSCISDLSFIGPGTGTSTKSGIIYNNANFCSLVRVLVSAFNKGVEYQAGINSSYLNSMHDCQIVKNKTINIDAQLNTNALKLYQTTFGGAPCLTGLKVVNSTTLAIYGGDCEGTSVCGIELDATATLFAGHIISGVDFEANTGRDIRIGNTALVRDVTLITNSHSPGAGADSAVDAVRCDGLAIISLSLGSGYTGVPWLRKGAATTNLVVLACGVESAANPVNRIYTNFDTPDAQSWQAVSAFDSNYGNGANANQYSLLSTSMAASKKYTTGVDIINVNPGAAPGAGATAYGRYVYVNNGHGSGANVRGAAVQGGALDITQSALAYSASMTPNAAVGNSLTITATNGTAFTINAPINTPPTGVVQRLKFTLKNTSGGALGAATWNAVFKMSAWTNPANGQNRSIEFEWDGTNWLQMSQTGVDVPN